MLGIITLPLIRLILSYTLITSLIGGLQMFDVPQLLTNGQEDRIARPIRSSCRRRSRPWDLRAS